MKSRNRAVGVDIGGTNVKLGLVDKQGHLICHHSLPLPRDEHRIADLSAIGSAIGQFIRECGKDAAIGGVGVSSPGILDIPGGVVLHAINLGWNRLPLVEQLQEQLKLPIRLQSDAVAGANGERRYGAGVGLSHFLYICIGTGVGASVYGGCGFYQGEHGAAINIGHTSVIHNGKPCKCGNRGCLETYVSASALAERAQMDAIQVWKAARNGDSQAKQLFREAGEMLGICLVNCLQLFGVGHLIVGGGLSQAGTYLLDPARQIIAERFQAGNALKVSLTSAAFPATAGIMGAAAGILYEED